MEAILLRIVEGSLQLLDPYILFIIVVGTIFGVILGILPGLTSTMGVALLVPVTFGMPPAVGLALLGAIYCSSTYSGAITSILINIPGTPANCCSILDGYPMTLKGDSSRAIALATSGSCIGGLLGVIALLFLAPPLAEFALHFGPQEYFLLALFGVSVIASLSEGNLLKGLFSGALGLLLSIAGMHPLTGDIRFSLGMPELYNGLPLVIALIGLYSLPEVIALYKSGDRVVKQTSGVGKGVWSQMMEIFDYKIQVFRATVIGIIVGIIPGAGASISSFVAYSDAKRVSKSPETFGHGNPEGVVASETANNALVGGTFVPTLTLGIPGNAVTAVLMGGLMIHGLRPGPQLFIDNSVIIYCFIMSLFISNLTFVPVGLFIARYCVKLVEAPAALLGPMILGLAVMGAYALNTSMVEVGIMLAMGFTGYVMKIYNVPREPMVLGLVLGPIAEGELGRAMALAHGSLPDMLKGMLTDPLSLSIIALTVFSLYQGIKSSRKHTQKKT